MNNSNTLIQACVIPLANCKHRTVTVIYMNPPLLPFYSQEPGSSVTTWFHCTFFLSSFEVFLTEALVLTFSCMHTPADGARTGEERGL